MTVTRIKPRADLIYGASKTRKTSNIGMMAEYVFKKYNKVTRLITCDGGGYDPVMTLVDAGIIIPWVPIARKFTISLIDLACQGWWPKDPEDPESPLTPPTAETWEQVGGYGIEGLTSCGDAFIRQFKADKAHLSQDPSYTYTEVPVNVEVNGKAEKRAIGYSGGNMSYYGAGQDQLYDFVLKSHMLRAEKVLWTALEGKGEEEGSRAPIYGPAIIGRKSTGKAPQWFGNCVHIEQLVTRTMDEKTKQQNVDERPIMYLRTHCGADNIPYPCGTRAPYQIAGELPQYLDPPDISELYRRLDEMNERVGMKMREMRTAVVVPAAPAPAAPKDDLVQTLKEIAVAATPIPNSMTANVFIPPRISVKKPV